MTSPRCDWMYGELDRNMSTKVPFSATLAPALSERPASTSDLRGGGRTLMRRGLIGMDERYAILRVELRVVGSTAMEERYARCGDVGPMTGVFASPSPPSAASSCASLSNSPPPLSPS